MTPEGELALKELTAKFPEAAPNLIRFFLLCEFSHLGLLIDPATTDSEKCLKLLRELDELGACRWAPVLGKELYTKFNSSDLDRSDFDRLPAKRLELLLKDTSKGILQSGRLLLLLCYKVDSSCSI